MGVQNVLTNGTKTDRWIGESSSPFDAEFHEDSDGLVPIAVAAFLAEIHELDGHLLDLHYYIWGYKMF